MIDLKMGRDANTVRLGRGLVLAAVSALALMVQPAAAVEDASLRVATLPPPSPDFYFPGANMDPAVPSPGSVLGYEIGTRISGHADIERYFEALAGALPDRVRLVTYGQSWQGRRLFYAVIGTREQIARLDAIQSDARALADPRTTSPGQADAIIARQPAIVWIASTVHGDEPGPSDAAMLTAWHLLAARGDPRIASMRANTLVIINPLQNPDGRERFIATSTSARGVAAADSPLAAERDQQWPGGRANHYIFDLNRDWFALTQPETRAHTAAMLQWYPQVMVDAHEMGTEESYFFPPEADPINPFHTAEQRALRALIGRNNGRRFDEAGLRYFTREIFDGFYPGYGDGWPTMHGTIAMTYEQGSSRGLLAQRRDGSVLTYPDTVRSQFIAALSTIEATADNRERFVRSFWNFRRSAVDEGRTGAVRSYIIPTQADQSTADHLAGLLVRQGVDVRRATAAFSACGTNYAAGSHIISLAQPSSRLIRNLLDPKVEMDPTFIARQQALRERGLDDELYDVTAWSLPLVFNVAVNGCNAVPAPASVATGPQLRGPGSVTRQSAQVAWVAPTGSVATQRLAIAALRDGLTVRSMETAFTVDGASYPAGSLVIARSENPADVEARIARLATETGARLVGHDTSWVTEGPSFGSTRARRLRMPRIAMAWDQPVGRNAAGNARYTLEVKLGFSVTPVRVSRLRSADLRAFDVIVLPDSEG
nr:M14 family metallopeptidase [Hyphomonadaceae bacterium]